jgi:nicotinate-nucleotide adenylyltransferase
MAGKRVGIFGGTFNPVHIGHLRAVIEVAEALGLDAVELVPAARPPHKCGNGLLDFSLRLALCRLAVAGLAGCSVNALEADRPGPSYTWDTLSELRRTRPDDELVFIMGMGDLLCLGQWKSGYDLGRLAGLAVHARAGLGLSTFTDCLRVHGPLMGAVPTADPAVWTLGQSRCINFVPVARLDISASDIRERWRRGAHLDHLVPDAVLRELLARADVLTACWQSPAGT